MPDISNGEKSAYFGQFGMTKHYPNEPSIYATSKNVGRYVTNVCDVWEHRHHAGQRQVLVHL